MSEDMPGRVERERERERVPAKGGGLRDLVSRASSKNQGEGMQQLGTSGGSISLVCSAHTAALASTFAVLGQPAAAGESTDRPLEPATVEKTIQGPKWEAMPKGRVAFVSRLAQHVH